MPADERAQRPSAPASPHGLLACVGGVPHAHAALFLLLAALAAADPDSDTASRERGAVALEALLAAARESGFMQCDILHTLLASGDFSERTIVLARQAMQGVSAEVLAARLRDTGVFPA